MSPKRVLMALPSYGFDPSESSIPYKILTDNGIEVHFATPDGKPAAADDVLLTGKGFGIWRWLLMTRADALEAYARMTATQAYRQPLTYQAIRPEEWDGLLLPGGHHKGMRPYLESPYLQQAVVHCFQHQKPIGAVCHGVLLVARSIDPRTGKSVLYDYKTTALLQFQERSAYRLTQLWMGDYYITYPGGQSVQAEVTSVLSDKTHFLKGNSSILRDDMEHLARGFALRDRHYVSARWPGDVYNFGLKLLEVLQGK